MGIGDFFARMKVDREQKTLLKNIRRLIHQDLQHEDRLRAAEWLSEQGTPEALLGLLRRYDMSLEKGYMDQDEKTFVHDILVSKGAAALEPVEKFIRSSENVSWPERILASILKDDEKIVGVLLKALGHEREAYSDMRATKRANLLSLFTRYEDARIAPEVVPFLEDFDEAVRIAAVEVLDHQGDRGSIEPLLKLLVSPEEESFRVKVRIMDAFVSHGWGVPEGWREAVRGSLTPEFTLGADGQVAKRG